MPTERQIVDAYTRRALELIRLANSVDGSVQRDLRTLARELRAMLGGVDLPAMGRREVSALLRRIDAAIQSAYSAISARQYETMAVILATDAAWARRASGLMRRPGESALSSATSGLMVLGLPLSRHWQRQSSNFADRIAATLRTAATTHQPDFMAAIFGEGLWGRERGGLFGAARQQAATLVDTSTHSAAYAGRRIAWKAGGVKYLKWHAILDSRTTIHCATRAGKVYDTEYQPVGHDIPMGEPPPAHWNCRSLLAAMSPDYEPPGDGQDPYSESLDDWLSRHSEQMQDEMLGRGRASAWRAGKISTRDLLGQRGQTLTLEQIKER